MQLAPALSAGTSAPIGRLATAPSFDDDVTVRQVCFHPNCPALGVAPPPTMMMIVIHMFANDHVVTITNNNFRGNRNAGCHHSKNGSTNNNHFHFSLLCSPAIKTLEASICFADFI